MNNFKKELGDELSKLPLCYQYIEELGNSSKNTIRTEIPKFVNSKYHQTSKLLIEKFSKPICKQISLKEL